MRFTIFTSPVLVGFVALSFCLCTRIPSAQAVLVVNPSANTATLSNPNQVAAYSTFSYWNNIGSQDGGDGSFYGGGVYLGNGYLLAPQHIAPVRANGFYINGAYYATQSYTPLYNDFPTDSSSTDLMLYKLQSNPNVPAIQILPSSPAVGTQLLMMGWGHNTNSTPTYYGSNPNGTGTSVRPSGAYNYYGGYQWASSEVLRWGTNLVAAKENFTVSGYGTVQGFESTFSDPLYTYGSGDNATLYEAAASGGDSGGGVFVQSGGTWYLAGLIHDVDGYVDANGNTYSSFANPNIAGDTGYSYFSDLSAYASQIDTLMTPEPTGAAVIGIVAAAGLLRRRRV